MSHVLLFLGALLLIATLGIHTSIISGNRVKRPRYTRKPSLMLLPWLCGLILPIFAWTQLTNIPWGWLLLLNFVLVFFGSPILAYLIILIGRRKRKKMSRKLVTTLALGIVFLVVGSILHG